MKFNKKKKSESEQNTLMDTSPKKIYRWPKDT